MTPILFSKARNITIVNEVLCIHREVPTSISRSVKLSPFYFEQLDSGDILLQYALHNDMPYYYQYKVGAYVMNILRLYCLMDDYLGQNEIKHYKKKIKEKVMNYRTDFFFKSTASVVSKTACLMYLIHQTILKLFS